MDIQLTFDNVRAALITEFSKAYMPARIQLGTGNIYQVGVIQLLNQDAMNTIQLAYEGTIAFEDYGGGNWRRTWVLGVGVFVETSQDQLDRNTQAAKDMINITRACSEVIHQFDDFYDGATQTGNIESTAALVGQTFESPIAQMSINEHVYLHVKQQYQVLGKPYPYTAFKALR